MKAQAYYGARYLNPVRRVTYYVSSLPSKGTATRERAADFGYSPHKSEAIPLSPYWRRRFMSSAACFPRDQFHLIPA